MRILFAAGKASTDRLALFVADALRHRYDTTTELFHRRLDVLYESIKRERTLRKIDQVGTIVLVRAGKRGSGSQKASVTAHDDIDLHSAECAVVEIIALDRTSHKSCRRGEPRRMVATAQIVVDRLRDMVDNERIAILLRLFADDSCGIGRIVAADVEEEAHIQTLELLEYLPAIIRSRLHPTASKRRGWSEGNGLKFLYRRFAQVDIVAPKNALNAMACSKDLADLGSSLLCGKHSPDERSIDDHGRTTRLGDHHIVGFLFHWHTPIINSLLLYHNVLLS